MKANYAPNLTGENPNITGDNPGITGDYTDTT